MRTLAGKLLLSFLSLTLTLSSLELAFRILDIRGFHADRTRDWHHALLPRAERIPGIDIQFRPHSEFRLGYDSNPRGYFDADNGLTYQLNRHGFRGPDFPKQKPEENYRIMVLGDSFTFGEGVRYDDIFTSRLQSLLREKLTPIIRVLNFGVSGWSTHHEIAFLRHAGRRFEPDLVLLVFVLNDANYAGGLDLFENFRHTYEPPALLRRSYFAGYVYARIAQHIVGRRYVSSLVESSLNKYRKWQKTLGRLQRGKELAASIGAEFAVIVFPFMYELGEDYPFGHIHDMVRSACEEYQIPILDLFDAFYGRSYPDLWVHPSDQHPNEEAHAIAAAAMARFLSENQAALQLPGAVTRRENLAAPATSERERSIRTDP